MRQERMRRIFTMVAVMALVVGTMSLTGAGTAGACEELQIKLPAVARAYDVGTHGHFIDGVVTNDTTQTVVPTHVKITWAENSERTDDEWICSGPIDPGAWVTFHAERPCGVPATWTPVVTGYAWPSDSDTAPLALTIDSVSTATVGEHGGRTYSLTVTNGNTVPVSSIDMVGVERDATSGAFVDALDSCSAPDMLAPGESATFDVSGRSPWSADVTTDIHVTALEQPTISLAADTTNPAYGSPVTFTLSLTHADGSPAEGDRTLKLFASCDGENWCDYECYDTDTGIATAVVTPDSPKYFKAVYWGDEDLGCAESSVIFITPQVTATTPSLPARVHRRHAFKVRGRITAGAQSAGKPVHIITERWNGSRWVKTATVTAAADSVGRYIKSVKLSSAGSYRIRAFRAGVGYSHYKKLKVEK